MPERYRASHSLPPWLLGLTISYTLGGFHLLLVLAIIVILVRVIQRRKPIP